MALYHIANGGTRTTGESTPDDFSAANCYDTMADFDASIADNDTIIFADGTYTSSAFENAASRGYALLSEGITIKAQTRGGVTLQSGIATGLFRWSADLSGNDITIDGFIIEEGTTAANYYIWVDNSSATKGTLTVTHCSFSAPVFYSVYNGTSSDMDVTVSNCNHLGGGRSFLNSVDMDDGDVLIQNCTVNISEKNNSTPMIDIDASASGVTAIVEDCTLSFTITGTVAQEYPQVRIRNIDDAIIRNNSLSVFLGTGGGVDGSAALAIIECDDATLTAHRGKIYNNTGFNDADGGFLARIGQDGSSVGDNLANDGAMVNNLFTGGDNFRAGGGHGMFFGFVTDCNSYFNKVKNVQLGLLCKQTTGGGHFSNEISNFGASGIGTALQAKGATNALYYGNYVKVTADCEGDAVVNDDDSGTNTTGSIIESNIIDVVETTDASLDLMTAGALQTASFVKNLYRGLSNVTKASPFNYQGTTYTETTWVSSIEDDAVIDPSSGAVLYTKLGGGAPSGIISNSIISR